MTVKKNSALGDLSTIEKIKETARSEFMNKGYAATRIRDIAKVAGINLSLLNYYFGSKENLFEIVMTENIDLLFSVILPVLNDTQTSLSEKLDLLSEYYITMILKEPHLPIFVLNEIQNHPERFANQIKFNTEFMESYYMKQLAQADPSLDPVQHMITYLSILLFPFFMKPVMMASGTIDNGQFEKKILERKLLAPTWMKTLLKLN